MHVETCAASCDDVAFWIFFYSGPHTGATIQRVYIFCIVLGTGILFTDFCLCKEYFYGTVRLCSICAHIWTIKKMVGWPGEGRLLCTVYRPLSHKRSNDVLSVSCICRQQTTHGAYTNCLSWGNLPPSLAREGLASEEDGAAEGPRCVPEH